MKAYSLEELCLENPGENLVFELEKLINEVYEGAESELWVETHKRLKENEVKSLLSSKGFYVLKDTKKNIVGCIKLEKREDSEYEFGLFAVKPEKRSQGFGTQLMRHVEDQVKNLGKKHLHLKVLTPKDNSHEGKNGLILWYEKAHGYSRLGRAPLEIDEHFPVSELAADCEFLKMRKEL